MIDKKIEDRLYKILDEEFCCEVHLTPFEKAIPKIKSLFKEYAMEIIGEDEDLNGIDKFYPNGSFDALFIRLRNQLRAEQREKLLTDDKKK